MTCVQDCIHAFTLSRRLIQDRFIFTHVNGGFIEVEYTGYIVFLYLLLVGPNNSCSVA